MSTRHLDALFNPRSIALIGASDVPGSIGAVLAENLLGGAFEGRVMPVNPHHRRIRGIPVSPDLGQLPEPADLGVICTPPEAVPGIVADLGAQGARAALIITAGFAEDPGVRGQALQRALLDVAGVSGLRLCGPNCVGIQVPGIGLNASFAHRSALPGEIAFVAQSGAMITAVLDWAATRGIGFSHLVSLGDMVDLDLADMLDYLAGEAGTRAILLYIESVGDARRLIAAARNAARIKPVVALKAGRHAEAARAVASHTGAMAGSDAVCEAAFERAGVLRVETLAELLDAVEVLARARPPRGDRLAILTNGGGAGVLATDALIGAGGRLAELSGETLAALERALPCTWSHGNPVDLVGDAGAGRYAQALDALRTDPGVDAILVMHCPTAVASPLKVAEIVVRTAGSGDGPPILTSWLGGDHVAEARRLLDAHGVPCHQTPERAVSAFMLLVRRRRAQRLLAETEADVSDAFVPDKATVEGLVAAAIADGRTGLTEPESKRVLAAYGVPVVETRWAGTAWEAAEIAAGIGRPVALKVLSPDIGHKSDVDGVVLDLSGPAAVSEAAEAMLRRIRAVRPEARILGLTVQPMVCRPGAHELIVGATLDPQFGPVILVGQGGIEAEAIGDKALALPPLSPSRARELISRTRIHRVLQGVRGRPAADLDAVSLTLVRVSRLVIDIPEVRELDINPLLVDADGVIALDACITLAGQSLEAPLEQSGQPRGG